MGLNIDEVISDFFILHEGHVVRDGFIFTAGQQFPTIFNRLVIRTPERARGDENCLGYSYRTLEEHIQLINKYKIEKVLIICDNLDFILRCPSVTDIVVYPSYNAPPNFDYSVLYDMPKLKSVSCRTTYGDNEQFGTTIDYSRISGLEAATLNGHGHLGYENASTLKKIWISGDKRIGELSEVSCSPVLEEITFLQCGIRSLNGAQRFPNLRSITLFNNNVLRDISALENVAQSLEELTIETCPKVNDFTMLNSLRNLRVLYLLGNNKLPNLDFLKNMKELMLFHFTMNVENGDLSDCLHIPYVTCQNRRHYNLKDKDLSKDLYPIKEYQKARDKQS